MKLDGEFRFDAPREEVWQSLLDPEVLAQVMPGCEKLELVGENAYEGTLKIKVGPVQGKFQGKVRLMDLDAPNGYKMEVDGRGAPGFVKADAEVLLADAEGGGTVMTYLSEARVGGKIASVGQRLLDSSAKAIVKQSLEGLNQILQTPAEEPEPEKPEPAAESTASAESSAAPEAKSAPEAPKPKPKPRSTYRPPTQAQFAANVAKDVIDDLVPQPVQIGIVAGLVAALILLIFRR